MQTNDDRGVTPPDGDAAAPPEHQDLPVTSAAAAVTPLSQDELTDLHHALDSSAAGREVPPRVERIEVNTHGYWVKRQEHLSLRWRLQKGDPAEAFERERQGLHQLHDLGLPVPPIVDEGPDYFVIPEAGVALSRFCSDPATRPEERDRALAAAALALLALHEAGQAHGRPELRDILWDGRQISLIDFERFGKFRRIHAAQVLDLVIFTQSGFAQPALPAEAIASALAIYARHDRKGIHAGALRWMRRLSWAAPLVRLLARLKPKREFLGALRLFGWLKTLPR